MLAVFTVAIQAGSTNLSTVAQAALGQSWQFLAPSQMLAFAALFIVLIAETGRIPADNPATHLELTMIHEAMILEYSGPYLALIEWSAKQAHKLTDELLAFLVATRQKEPAVRTPELARLLQERFGTKVHPRSIERSLLRRQKKLR